MFSPEMMATAQKMMANMKPEDMQRMSQMAANMDPKVMEGMMKNMGGGVPSGMDTAKAVEQMKNMSPEEIQAGMSQAQRQMAGQKQYMCKAAEMLKNEGNDCIKKENYAEALSKYGKALDNLKSHAGSEEVSTLQVNLLNNSALCHLKTKDFTAALDATQEALKVDPRSFKALFRRGQARAELGNLAEAVVDVRRASELSPSDKAIAKELEQLRARCKEKGIEEPSASEHEVSAAWQATPSTSSGSRASSNSSQQAPAAGADGDRWAKAAEKLAENPDMLKQASDAMSKLSPEELQKMMSNSPLPPGVDAETMRTQMEHLQKNPDMLKTAMDNLQALPEEERKAMLASRYGAGGGPGMPGMAGPPAGKPDMKNMAQVFENPDMIRQAMEMTKGMSEEDLKRMNIKSPEEADMMRKAAEQMASDPNLTKQMSDMMKNMSPEQMESMMNMSSAMRGGGGGSMDMGGKGGGSGGMDPAAMMGDPDMMKAAEQMMSNMSPEMLSSMAKANGVDISEDKAKMVAKFLPYMLKLMRVWGYVKKAWSAIWSKNGRVILAVTVVGIAMIQHYRS
mmetsp:Transcript_91112/g.195379  ORF Transcript_91112/g.195379 Transcript_91112/m.195379 type:complete len:566 (-) Transcript_91112:181-1878(-)